MTKWDGKQEPMAPAVKRWKRTQLLITGVIITGSGMIVAGLILVAWKLL